MYIIVRENVYIIRCGVVDEQSIVRENVYIIGCGVVDEQSGNIESCSSHRSWIAIGKRSVIAHHIMCPTKHALGDWNGKSVSTDRNMTNFLSLTICRESR